MLRLEREGDFLTVHGNKPLVGEFTVRGAKNFVSKVMVAALLAPGKSVLSNVPKIRDVKVVSSLLRLHGCDVDYEEENGVLTVDAANVTQPQIADVETLSGASRIPILFCGPLLHRLGEAFIPDLGGCVIGGRPVDYHFEALRKFGAEVEKVDGGVHLSAPNGLHGTRVELPYPSVGATEQVLLAAVCAKGRTQLVNAAVEPEILNEIDVLQKMGAIINIDTDRVIRIEGVSDLHPYKHHALTDRIEVGSWASAALATHGDIYIHGAKQSHMTTFLNQYRKIGGEFDIDDKGIRFFHPGGKLTSTALETDVHPGFATDWQQPFVVALTQADGISIVHETVYEERLGFVGALKRMGANVELYRECLGATKCRFYEKNYEHSAVIAGSTPLRGANILVPDLRGGFSYLIAALAATGTSRVFGISLIDRGYEFFREKLTAVGAEFE